MNAQPAERDSKIETICFIYDYLIYHFKAISNLFKLEDLSESNSIQVKDIFNSTLSVLVNRN